MVTKDSLLVEFDSVVLGTVGADCGCFVVEDWTVLLLDGCVSKSVPIGFDRTVVRNVHVHKHN